MDRSGKVVVAAVVLWLLGLFLVNRILVVSGSFSSMFSETTPNPSYNPGLNDLMVKIAVRWSVLCLVCGAILSRWTSERNE